MNTERRETMRVGTKVRFQGSHSDGSMYFYTARVVRDNGDGTVYVEMPPKVRALPFAPLGGKRYGMFRVADIQQSVVR